MKACFIEALGSIRRESDKMPARALGGARCPGQDTITMDYSALCRQIEGLKNGRTTQAPPPPPSPPPPASSSLTGEATWYALQCAVQDLAVLAPSDHDVLMQVGDSSVLKARFVEPHTFLFEGINQEGYRTRLVAHFSQVAARVTHRPQRGTHRVMTEFAASQSA